MVIPRAEGARLMDPDPTIHHGTSKPQKFLRDNGTIAIRVVDSILPPVRIGPGALDLSPTVGIIVLIVVGGIIVRLVRGY